MDLVKEESFWEIDEENKKFDFEVYPHMVEQIVCKIKEAQEKSHFAARDDFDELIERIQKLAKVIYLTVTVPIKRGVFLSGILW